MWPWGIALRRALDMANLTGRRLSVRGERANGRWWYRVEYNGWERWRA